MRPLGQLFVWLLIAGFLLMAIKALLILVAIAAVVAGIIGVLWGIYKGSNRVSAAQRRRAAHRYSAEMATARARLREQTELIARCEEQNQQVLAGDERGIYGTGYDTRMRFQQLCDDE